MLVVRSVLILAVLPAVARSQAPCAVNNACDNNLVKLCAAGPNVGKDCVDDSDCAGAACRAQWQEFFIDAGKQITCIPNYLANGGSGADGVDLADFDGDGDVDVVTGWEESGITYVYLNPCNPYNPLNPSACSNAAAVRDTWPAMDVRGGAGTGDIEDAAFADFDLDGRPDGVATATEGHTQHVKVHGLTLEDTWLGESLPGTKHLYMQVRVADINGDGCGDIVSGNKIAHPSIYDFPPGCYDPDLPEGTKCSLCPSAIICDEIGGIWWWECPTGIDPQTGATVCAPFGYNFLSSPPQIDTSYWNKRRIDKGFVWIMGLDLKDMDGDGDNDVLYSDRREVGWFRNRTDEGNLAGWNAPIRIDTEQAILDRKDGTNFSSDDPFRFHAYGDVDGDGLKDVVVTASFSKGFCAIDRNTVCETDADCAAGDSCINNGNRFAGYFYRRLDASGESWEIHPIFVKGGLPYGLDYRGDKVSKGVAIGDVNGDGRNDLVFSVRGAGHSMYMLTYDPAPGQCGPCVHHEWNAWPIAPCRKLSKYDNVQLADIDRDGRLDVVSTEENFAPGDAQEEAAGLGVVWYRNLGFCGNGVVEESEECDNGAANGTFGQCCDSSCRLTQGNVCRNSGGGVCDAAEICTGTYAFCPPDNVPVGMPCGGSSEPCSDMACDENGLCVPATEGQTCPDDSNQCTRDVCSGSACVHPYRLNESCDPGYGDPECSAGVCLASNDTVICSWRAINQGAPCGDLEAQGPCDMPDTCDYGTCNPNYLAPQLCRTSNADCYGDAYCTGISPDCPANPPLERGYSCTDDGNACTDERCDGHGVCTHPLRVSGWLCGIGDECNQQRCDGAGTCETVPVSGPCGEDDGNPCTVSTCVDGGCEVVVLSDGVSCTDDQNPCTNDECVSGICEHLPLIGQACDFDDGNPCTRSVCGEDGLCSDTVALEGLACGSQSSDACDAPDTCNALGQCQDNVKPEGYSCAMSSICLGRRCDGVSPLCPEGQPAPQGTPCGYDGNSCTINECDGLGACVVSFAPADQPCPDDGNRCTHDTCDGAGTCTHVAFDDGSPCVGSNGCERCASGECITLPAGSLCGLTNFGQEDTICTDPDTCDKLGVCQPNHAPDGTTCDDDGVSCTSDVCEQGQCAHPPLGQPSVPAGLCSLELSPAGSGLALAPSAGTFIGVQSFLTFDAGSGEELYAAGGIAGFGADPALFVARWDGLEWAKVGNALGSYGNATALGSYNDGTGSHLYAAGRASDYFVAKLDNGVWSASLGTLDSTVYAMTSYDDGNGAALYVGGRFTNIDGAAFNGIAKWNGTSWSAVGSGVADGPFSDPPAVLAMMVYDFGSGPVLVVGGDFATAGGGAAQSIAQWNGTTWAPVAPATPIQYGSVEAFAVYDDGHGSTLFIGGDFSLQDASSNYINDVARLGSAGWEAMPSVFGTIKALEPYDDGTGTKLFAAGFFSISGVSAPCCFAQWDGTSWTPPGPCVNDGLNALVAFDDGSVNGLFLGGRFTDVEGTDYVARWACTGDNDCNNNQVPDELDPDCDGNGTPDECDLAAGGTDCQPNGILDVCELVTQDENQNDIPDDCDLFQKFDWSADCAIDVNDVLGLAGCIRGPQTGAGSICRFVFDDNQDDDVDLADAAAFFRNVGAVPPLPCE